MPTAPWPGAGRSPTSRAFTACCARRWRRSLRTAAGSRAAAKTTAWPLTHRRCKLRLPAEHLLGATMSLRINDTAPNFTAETTQGPIDFHQWIGDKWAVLFSHPKDFTPVCTTELGYMARIENEFTKRNARLIGLSIDPVADHSKWAADIEETQGAAVKYPMIGDTDLAVAKTYNMLPADDPGTTA